MFTQAGGIYLLPIQINKQDYKIFILADGKLLTGYVNKCHKCR